MATRSSKKRTAKSVARKLTTRGAKKASAVATKKLGLKMVYCAPEGFKLTGLPRGRAVSLDWDEHAQVWKATVDGIIHRLPTFFVSPKTAKKDPKDFARQAITHLEHAMAMGPRPISAQKGPLAIGVTS